MVARCCSRNGDRVDGDAAHEGETLAGGDMMEKWVVRICLVEAARRSQLVASHGENHPRCGPCKERSSRPPAASSPKQHATRYDSPPIRRTSRPDCEMRQDLVTRRRRDPTRLEQWEARGIRRKSSEGKWHRSTFDASKL